MQTKGKLPLREKASTHATCDWNSPHFYFAGSQESQLAGVGRTDHDLPPAAVLGLVGDGYLRDSAPGPAVGQRYIMAREGLHAPPEQMRDRRSSDGRFWPHQLHCGLPFRALSEAAGPADDCGESGPETCRQPVLQQPLELDGRQTGTYPWVHFLGSGLKTVADGPVASRKRSNRAAFWIKNTLQQSALAC